MPKSKRTTTVRRTRNVITFTDIASNPDPKRLEELAGLTSHRVDSSTGEPTDLILTFENPTAAKKAYERMFVGDESLPDAAGGVAGVDLFTHRDDDWPNAKIKV